MQIYSFINIFFNVFITYYSKIFIPNLFIDIKYSKKNKCYLKELELFWHSSVASHL